MPQCPHCGGVIVTNAFSPYCGYRCQKMSQDSDAPVVLNMSVKDVGDLSSAEIAEGFRRLMVKSGGDPSWVWTSIAGKMVVQLQDDPQDRGRHEPCANNCGKAVRLLPGTGVVHDDTYASPCFYGDLAEARASDWPWRATFPSKITGAQW